jgi:hypothetical protein
MAWRNNRIRPVPSYRRLGQPFQRCRRTPPSSQRIPAAHATSIPLIELWRKYVVGSVEFGQVLISRASSTSRCNTIHCVDSTMLARENHLFGCPRSKPSQSSVPTGLALASDFGFCFQCEAGSSLVLRRPIEITVFSRSWVRNLGNAASEGHQQTLRDKSGTISHNAISGPLDGFGLGRYNPVRTSNYAPEES